MEMQKRNPVIDILKGLGIILMVAGHSGFPFTRFIYLFHMAIFFMASGFCFKSESSANVGTTIKFIKRRFIILWLPYVVWTTLFSLLHNVFISLNVYTNNPLIFNYTDIERGGLTDIWSYKTILKNICMSLLLSGGTQMGGALWFICILMKISLLYIFFDFIIKRFLKNTLIIQAILSVLLLCTGFIFHLRGISFLSFDKVLSYYCLFYFGFCLKSFNICERFDSWYSRLFIFTGAFIILIICKHFGRIELADTHYTNPVFLIITSVCGWMFLYELSYFISKNRKLADGIIVIGKNTIAVVILHFLCFKIVSFIGIIITDAPEYVLACFPTYMKTGAWWAAYTIIGVGIPVLLSVIYKLIKQKVVSKCLQNEQNSIV